MQLWLILSYEGWEMTKKIRRNDPCPCGSGKKYKYCCMRSDNENVNSYSSGRTLFQSSGLDAPKLEAYMANHDCAPILDYLIALQMNPQNHGKNLRLEHIAQLAVSSLGKSSVPPSIDVLKKLIDEEYPKDVMEDIPMNMYAETVVFHGGNYMFFPGLSTHVTELFRSMTDAIYYRNDIFKTDLQKEVYQGVLILLELGEMIAYRAGIKGLVRGNENPRELISEPNAEYSYVINEQMMTEILRHFGLERKILDSFILDTDNPKLLTKVANENPLLYKPIVHYNSCYFFVGITNQGCAINNFILKTAVKHGCLPQLVEQTQYSIWMRIGASCIDYMHWQTSQFDGLMHDDEHYYEVLFQIDVNWLSYVCYAKDTATDVSIDGQDGTVHWDIDSKLRNTLSTLRKDVRTKNHHIFTLVLYSSMGESFTLTSNKQSDSDYLLMFSAFDFLQLIQTEKWDNMSLVRFARTRETKEYLNTPFNQVLDIYSFYKHYGESFYFSDDEAPNFLHIEPNDGCLLISESKEKLNFHGTPLTIGGRLVYIPVQRDMDYADIYKPIHSSVTAKSCESYSVPVWVRCSQTEKEGLNPSSITDTVITAVVYWLDVLRPSIEEMVKASFKNPVEIELVFSDEVLSDKGLHAKIALPKTAGSLNVVKTTNGVSATIDHDYILSFMGANNESEREMMKRIIKVLLGIDEVMAQDILDERIPFGQAKMILMTETSNIPLVSPLWLHPPIYIHPATSQLMLDMFPQWMREKGNIITKLTRKKEKVDFLHIGVDVLLGKLSEKTSHFDTKALLEMLLNNHETLLYRREHNKVLQPAQILCFGDSEGKRKEFLDDETLLTDSGLSTRVLIEYLSATQNQTGHNRPGSDDVEELLAIASEIIRIGGICDAIHLDVSDHIIEQLDSGRYGIYDDDFNDNLGDFASAHSMENVNLHIEDFDDKMERLAIHEESAASLKDKEHELIDEAFEVDWGISYTNVLQFLYVCHLIAVNKHTSVLEITERELTKDAITLCPELTEDIIKKCLDRFSLDKRSDYLIPPAGMEGRDIFPWIYNRELSYLRRPIVRYVMAEGSIRLMFGFRSCIVAGLQLTDLLYSGRLRNVGNKLNDLLGVFEAKKGHVFNEEVRTFLQQIKGLVVWPYGVSMKSKGNLDTGANSDYGDIDILAFNPLTNTLYSIECKNTNTAKNVREMKTEMDEYLGRGDNPEKDKRKALVFKHLRRHQWFANNKEQVKKFIGVDNEPTIKSMMLTASVIPTSYLKTKESPLSILNYPELKLKGLDYLDSSKEPDLSVLN